jgi:hypothetical protein
MGFCCVCSLYAIFMLIAIILFAGLLKESAYLESQINVYIPYLVFKLCYLEKLKLNCMVWVREQIIPTERLPLVGEMIANFSRIEGAAWSAWRIPKAVLSVF